MSAEPTIGERLLAMKEQTGLSLAEIARRSGYRGASSIQKLFRASYNPAQLDEATAKKLVLGLVGVGDPPITALEILTLTGMSGDFEATFSKVAHYDRIASKYIPVHKTRRLGSSVRTEEGAETPLFIRDDRQEGIFYFSCPDFLRPRRLFGLFLTVGNMWPRFEEGEPIFYEVQRDPVPGDDVVVTIVDPVEFNGAMIIGRLRLLHDEEVQIDQLSPRGTIVISRSEVISVYRIARIFDLLPNGSYAKFD